MSNQKLHIVIAGNPNSGKTTIFNELTGSKQHIGNYPGVTVDRKQGSCRYKNYELDIIDLPGTYSLTAYSIEEIVSRREILDNHPDVVVNILDASNIEKSLYLATQLIEMNVPLLLVFNMSDLAKQRGLDFNLKLLSELLSSPIVETVGHKNIGIKSLLKKIIEVANSEPADTSTVVKYGDELEDEIGKLAELLDEKQHSIVEKYGKRWVALKLLENDKEIIKLINDDKIKEQLEKSSKHLSHFFGDNPEIMIADKRYGFISGACSETVKSTVEARHNASDIADKIVLNKYIGMPIFLALMFVVFKLVFLVGDPLMQYVEKAFSLLGDALIHFWPAAPDTLIGSLLLDGVIAGVGGVIIFLPNILLLFFAIAVLEHSGYMARAAFVMDRIMHKIGLHGKSFIPMLIGFGCTIPAIMATRILENRRNRLTTIMVLPLISCGARFPIYALIIPVFFAEKYRGLMMWLMYLIGIVLAIIIAKILRMTAFKGQTVPFVMELPPYRMPTIRGVTLQMWNRSKSYLKKAGTIILMLSIILWAATSFPRLNAESLEGLDEQTIQQQSLLNSVAGRTGKFIEPVMKPLGFDWKISTALIGAAAAKEVFVSQMAIVYSLGEADHNSGQLRSELGKNYTPLQGFCVMLFCLISTPCIATLAICAKETESFKYAIAQTVLLTTLAYILTLIVYQVGMLF